MIKIKEISEGKYTLTRKDRMLPGIYHKIERVSENINFYCLWSDKKHFCLYDAKSNRYALKSSTLSDAQTFSRIEYYSEESQSFVAYRSDMKYAHIIYEDGTFESQTFKYVGAEKNGLRPVQDFKNKWYYYDTTERKRIKKTRHGIQLGTEGRLGEMFSTGEYVVYYTPKKLRIFASVNDTTIKSRDYFESIEEIEGRFFIGKLYAKNVYTIIKDYHIITPIGYYTSMPQYIKEHNLFIAMKGSSWCVIYPNGKEIQNYQWTDDCFFFTKKYVFNKKKESSYWKIFNRENGQEVITRWKNIRLYNEAFFVDTEAESMKRISDEDIEKETNDYIKLLQGNKPQTMPHATKTIAISTEETAKTSATNPTPTIENTVRKKGTNDIGETMVCDSLPERIDYYVFVRHFSSKNQFLSSTVNCENIRGVAYIAWFIREENTFCITESRRTKVHKLLYVRRNILEIKSLWNCSVRFSFLYPITLNNLPNIIKGQTAEGLLCDFVKRKLIKTENKKKAPTTFITMKTDSTSSNEDLKDAIILVDDVEFIDSNRFYYPNASSSQIINQQNVCWLIWKDYSIILTKVEANCTYRIVFKIENDNRAKMLIKNMNMSRLFNRFIFCKEGVLTRGGLIDSLYEILSEQSLLKKGARITRNVNITKPKTEIKVSEATKETTAKDSKKEVHPPQIVNPMTKLQELYETREKLQSLGIEPNADLERQLAALEEDFIRTEIVPKMEETVEPVLKQVKRELVFVLEYHPEEGVHVQLSRKRNEVVNAVLEEKRTVSPQTIEPISNSSLQKLRVTFPDGEVIYERWVIETLGKTIIKLGIQKVANVCDFNMGSSLLHPAGISLVSKVYDSKYGVYQRPLEGEWLLFSNSNTLTKKRQIEYLAKALGVRLTVEIV